MRTLSRESGSGVRRKLITVRSKRGDWRPRALVAVLVGAQIVIGSITVQDVRRRPPELVRGPRLLWMLWGGTNTLGAALYWLLGRRRAPRGHPSGAPSEAGAAQGA